MGLFSEISNLFSSSDKEDSDRKEDMEKIRDVVKKEGKEGSKPPGRSSGNKSRPMPWNTEEETSNNSRESTQPPSPEKNSGNQKEKSIKPLETGDKEEKPIEPPKDLQEPKEDMLERKPRNDVPEKERYEKRDIEEEESFNVSAEEPPEVTDTSKKGANEGDVTPDFLVGDDPSEIKVPEAPELKEIEVPDIEKGPLFIRVEKFRKVERTLADMKRITDDIEAGIGGLRNGLDEDRSIRSKIEETINRLEASLGSAKDIMSP